MYDVDDPLGPVELHCPHAVPLGSWVECNGSLIRGTRINNTFFFQDGHYETISLSKFITLQSLQTAKQSLFLSFFCRAVLVISMRDAGMCCACLSPVPLVIFTLVPDPLYYD